MPHAWLVFQVLLSGLLGYLEDVRKFFRLFHEIEF